LSTRNLPDIFDFLVVGGGASGCVVAASLIEQNAGSVLLIEAGERASHPFVRRPVTYPRLFENPTFSHSLRSVPQSQLAQRRVSLPAGRGLGGSSLLNAMILCPPHPDDFDAWQRAAGQNWSWSSVQSASAWVESTFERVIDKNPSISPLSQQLLEAFQGTDQQGLVFPYRRAIARGRRVTAWSLLKGQCRSSRFTVEKGVSALKIVLDMDRAVGLEVLSHHRSTRETILARKGIILCAGAIGSPGLLLKSGIGPKEDAISTQPWQIDAPMVGKNLHDHMVFPITYSTTLPPLPSQFTRDEQIQWWNEGTGCVASNIAELGSFATRSHDGSYCLINPTHPEQPSMQWHITPTHYLEYPTIPTPSACLSVAVTLLHPKSRGEIRLSCDNSIEIDPAYLSVESDRTNLIQMIQWTRRYVETSPIAKFLVGEVLPGVRRTSDEQVSQLVDRLAQSIYHYVGSCAMGTNLNSVCDAEFQVRGCQGLYVCDASSMPAIVSGNTQWTVMLMARRLGVLLAGMV
jgi:choline dehydrogenase